MPADIQRSVNEENLQFMQHRDVCCLEYFEFIYGLTQCNAVREGGREGGWVGGREGGWVGGWEKHDSLPTPVFAGCHILDPQHPEQAAFGEMSMHLATNFFFHTYFRTRKKLR